MFSFLVYGENHFSNQLRKKLRQEEIDLKSDPKNFLSKLQQVPENHPTLGLIAIEGICDARTLAEKLDNLIPEGKRECFSRCVVLIDRLDANAAMTAFKFGILDYLYPPQDKAAWDLTIDHLFRLAEQAGDGTQVPLSIQDDRFSKKPFIGVSPKSVDLVRQGAKAIQQDCLLVMGETGTGKTVLVQTLVEELISEDVPFVRVDCGSIAKTLFQSALFGAEKGAYTGAYQATTGVFKKADKGVLFLDEIGNLGPEEQNSLLVALESSPDPKDPEIRMIEPIGAKKATRVRVKVVAATHLDLKDRIRRGMFSEPLYHRLARATLKVPPLRERREDIEPLARQIMEFSCARAKRPLISINDTILKVMKNYYWPGNVRELNNVITNIVVKTPGKSLRLEDLPESIRGIRQPEAGDSEWGENEFFSKALLSPIPDSTWDSIAGRPDCVCEEVEVPGGRRIRIRHLNSEIPVMPAGQETWQKTLERAKYNAICQALNEAKGNQAEAAKRLGMGRSTLCNYIHKLKIFLKK